MVIVLAYLCRLNVGLSTAGMHFIISAVALNYTTHDHHLVVFISSRHMQLGQPFAHMFDTHLRIELLCRDVY